MSLKAGLEVHQQLNCGKLFCKCDEFDVEDSIIFKRKLHATSSEMGNIDVAAKSEGIREFTYFNRGCNCLVYTDEEPPRGPNKEAVNIALQFAKLVNSTILEEVHFMRCVPLSIDFRHMLAHYSNNQHLLHSFFELPHSVLLLQIFLFHWILRCAVHSPLFLLGV